MATQPGPPKPTDGLEGAPRLSRVRRRRSGTTRYVRRQPHQRVDGSRAGTVRWQPADPTDVRVHWTPRPNVRPPRSAGV